MGEILLRAVEPIVEFAHDRVYVRKARRACGQHALGEHGAVVVLLLALARPRPRHMIPKLIVAAVIGHQIAVIAAILTALNSVDDFADGGAEFRHFSVAKRVAHTQQHASFVRGNENIHPDAVRILAVDPKRFFQTVF